MKHLFFSSLLSLVSALASLPSAHAAQTAALVQASQPTGAIVVASQAKGQEKRSAEILQRYLQKCTGALVPIVQDGVQNPEQPAIYVGRFEKFATEIPKDLDADGFLLKRVSPTAFLIVGGSDWGTEFGVSEFLERHLGVRWLAPTELFTVTPQRDAFSLPEENATVNPAFLSREFFPIEPERKPGDARLKSPSMAPYLHGDEWGRFNKLRARVAFHHALLDYLKPSKYAKEHPEFFPLVDGKRRIPPTDDYYQWQPNFSAPGIAQAMADEVKAYFKAHPDRDSFSFGINDSLTFDGSEESLKRRKGGLNRVGLEDISDDYYQWVNEVIALVRPTYPDKSYGLLAYLQVIEPPSKIKVDPAVVPYITYELTRWFNPPAREIVQNLTLAWEPAVPATGWYDYTYGADYLVPRSFPRAEQAALSWGHEHGVRHYYGEAVPNWGEGANMWVITKLLWNPNRDVNELLDDWYTAAAGPTAAPKLKAFYEIWERFWEKDIIDSPWYNVQHLWLSYVDPLYMNFVPMEYVKKADTLMTEALALADTDERKARVQALAQMWEVYRDGAIAWHGDLLWNDAHLRSEEEALAWFERCREAMKVAKQRQAALARMSEDPLFAHSAYRISMSHKQGGSWGTAPLWALLPWARKSEAVRAKLEALAQEDGRLAPPHNSYFDPNGTVVPMTHQGPEVAQLVLAAAKGDRQEMLKNPSFEEGLAGWSAGPFVVKKEHVLDGAQSLVMTAGPDVALKQSIPYEPGMYVAEVSFFTPVGSETGKGRVTVEVRVTNQKGEVMGDVPREAVLTPRPGEWVTTVMAVEAPHFPYPTEHLSILIRTKDMPEGQKLIFDHISLSRSNKAAESYRGTGPDGR